MILREDINDMLLVVVEEHVAAIEGDPDGVWKLLAWLEETQPTLNLESIHPYPSFMLRLILDDMRTATDAASLRKKALSIVERSLNGYHEHLFHSAREQLQSSIDRLGDQIEQRTSIADTAIEAAIMEMEESDQAVNADAIMGSVEEAIGMRIKRDAASLKRIEDDPYRFREQIPQLIEASMGLRVWAGLLQSIERRLGEPLGLEPALPTPIDWDEASERLPGCDCGCPCASS